jgi:hypothetical protein
MQKILKLFILAAAAATIFFLAAAVSARAQHAQVPVMIYQDEGRRT